jgi:hypothetical protein
VTSGSEVKVNKVKKNLEKQIKDSEKIIKKAQNVL